MYVLLAKLIHILDNTHLSKQNARLSGLHTRTPSVACGAVNSQRCFFIAENIAVVTTLDTFYVTLKLPQLIGTKTSR